jgi:hypothetical protein
MAFSAAASVACPNLVHRNTAASTAVTPTAMATSQSRSSEMAVPSPKRLRGVVGNGEATGVPWSPQICPATAMARKKTLRVATTRTRADAVRSRLITRTWVATPSAAGMATARHQASAGDQPRSPVAR